MHEQTSEAFVLRTRAYGESDRIVVLLTRDHGKVSGIARGARRSKRRFAGPALEPFQRLEVRYGQRPHSELVFLQECRVVQSYHGIAENLRAFAWASYLSELTEAMTPDHDPCPGLYAEFRAAIEAMAASTPGQDLPVERAGHRYIVGFLEWAGWGLNLDQCRACGEPFGESSEPIVDPRGGGLVCARHEREASASQPGGDAARPARRVVEPALLAYLRELVTDPSQACPSPTLLATATTLVHRLIDLHAPRPLKARAFLMTTAPNPGLPSPVERGGAMR
jgi:DNA repair protein RecO (recombination protein O)